VLVVVVQEGLEARVANLVEFLEMAERAFLHL
jgi:hypothetical protein